MPKGKTLINSRSSFGSTVKKWADNSRKFLIAFRVFYICPIVVGIIIEITVIYLIQNREYGDGIDNLLVLLIGGIPIDLLPCLLLWLLIPICSPSRVQSLRE